MSKLQPNQYNEAVQFTFKYFNKKADGFLDLNEFTQLFSNLKKEQLGFEMTTQIIAYLFSKFDRDNDGKVAIGDIYPVLEKAYYAA